MTARYAVVGCSDCSQLWILDTHDPEQPVTAECPRCGAGHLRRKLRPLAQHDDHAAAAELRSRILAERAGARESYETEDGYADQARRVDERFDAGDDLLAEEAEQHLAERENRFADLAEAYLEERDRYLQEQAERYLDEQEFALADEAERYLEDVVGTDETPSTSSGTLTLTQQEPMDPAADVTVDGTITTFANEVLNSVDVQEALIDAARSAATGRTLVEYQDLLADAGVDDQLAGDLLRVATGDTRAALQLLDGSSVDGRGTGHSDVGDLIAPLRVFALAEDVTPTVVVRLEDEFFDLRRTQRLDVCRWLSTLARGCDVRLVATGRQHRKLFDAHREDVPVSRDDIASRTGPVGDVVETARDDLDHDSREVEILRMLADAGAQTLSYHNVQSAFDVGRSRISQCISHLIGLELVETFEGASSKCVELLETGSAFLDALDAEIGRQAELGDCVSETRQSSPQAVLSRGRREGSPSGGPYRTAYLGRSVQAALDATAVDGGIAAVTHPADPDDRRVRGVSVSPDGEQVQVAWSAADAMPAVVSPAVALADPRVINQVLTDDRLEDLDEPPAILRGARCIGSLSDEALADWDVLREEFVEWGQTIEDLTTKLANGDYDDRDRFRGEILRSAHGLYGSLVHLFDALDVDVVRGMFIPEGLDERQHRAIATATTLATLIQSKYGKGHSAYRQLFEPREDRRDDALGLDVDAADPAGELLGSLVVLGDDVHRFVDDLEGALEHPGDLHEDAPEFEIPIPIVERTDARDAYAGVAARLLARKNLSPTRQGVTILQVFCGSPVDAARALYGRGLAVEERHEGRSVRTDEIRRALATLPADRIVPDETASASSMLAALLQGGPLSKSELAERADVATRTVSRTQERLEALGVVDVDDGEWSLVLEVDEDDATDHPVWTDDVDVVGALYELVETVIDEPERLADPDDPVGGAFFWPPDPDDVADELPWVGAWLPALRDGDGTPETVVSVGATPAQAALPTEVPA